MKPKHTSLPYHVGQTPFGDRYVVFTTKSAGVCEITGHLGQDQVADAEFIVLACNAHYALLEACQQAYDVIAGGCYHASPVANVLKAAIQEAKEIT